MLVIASGTPMVLQAPGGPVELRALADAPIETGWMIPVLAVVDRPLVLDSDNALHGEVEWMIDGNRVAMPAILTTDQGRFVVRASTGRANIPQRREDVRAAVSLQVRATLVQHMGSKTPAPLCFEGETVSLSGGGFAAVAADDESAPDGVHPVLPRARLTVVRESPDSGRAGRASAGIPARWYVELQISSGELVPAVVDVLEHRGRVVRAMFVEIEPRHRERLVRLVFERQRAELKELRFRPISDQPN